MYTGCSILDLEVGEVDLSRRKLEYRMAGSSFREYLAISYGYHLPVYSLENISDIILITPTLDNHKYNYYETETS